MTTYEREFIIMMASLLTPPLAISKLQGTGLADTPIARALAVNYWVDRMMTSKGVGVTDAMNAAAEHFGCSRSAVRKYRYYFKTHK